MIYKKNFIITVIAIIVCQVISSPILAEDVDDLPIAPLNPQTREDCQILRSKYSEMIAEKHREINRCMQSEPTIGKGRLCNGGYGLQAWPECGDIEYSRCELERAQDKTYKLCIEAVNAKGKKKIDYSSHEVNKLYEKGKVLGENAKSLYEAIREPEDYFKNILHDKFHEVVVGNEMDGFSKDETISHLYKYGYDYAKWGIEKTTDPVIQDFQKHILEKIGHAHKAMLQKINHIDVEMGNFLEELHNVNQRYSPVSNTFKPTPVASPSAVIGDSHQDCYLRKSSCEQSCAGDSVCVDSCSDEWYRCRYE
jgi:hypothetical protein